MILDKTGPNPRNDHSGMNMRLISARTLLGLTVTCLLISGAFCQTTRAPSLQSILNAQAADLHHDLKGVVVQQHGKTLAEAYFSGDGPTTLHDIRSATKSFTALLMGIAIDRHLVHSVDDPIGRYLPSLKSDAGTTVTIKDLLNMRSGLDSDDQDPSALGAESRLDSAPDWAAAAFAVPLKRSPGAKYVYSSLNAFLTGAIVESTSRMPLDAFAKNELFGPLGIRDFEWRHLADGRTTGQGNLQITTRDLARVGQLMLDGGRASGRQIVPKQWVDESLACQVTISDVDKYADCYGYMWYTKTENVDGHDILVHFASGNGGNKIYIVPSLDMIVAITSSAYNQPYGQQRSHQILLDVLAATYR